MPCGGLKRSYQELAFREVYPTSRFRFRGNDTVREAMHNAPFYIMAIKGG